MTKIEERTAANMDVVLEEVCRRLPHGGDHESRKYVAKKLMESVKDGNVTLEGLRPFLAPHFNLTVELPLKAIVRGYSWTVIPITWKNRRAGVAKLRIKEMGARYMFIVLYVWLEKYFSRGDFRKSGDSE